MFFQFTAQVIGRNFRFVGCAAHFECEIAVIWMLEINIRGNRKLIEDRRNKGNDSSGVQVMAR